MLRQTGIGAFTLVAEMATCKSKTRDGSRRGGLRFFERLRKEAYKDA
jgi:hypothetical protein